MMMPKHPTWLIAKTEVPFLLKFWTIDSVGGVVSAMLFTLTITILFECVNFELHLRTRRKRKITKMGRIANHAISTALRILALTLAYLIMLCIMSWNLWMFVCVLVGSGVGHQVVRPLLADYVDTRKQRRRTCAGTKEKGDVVLIRGHAGNEEVLKQLITDTCVSECIQESEKGNNTH